MTEPDQPQKPKGVDLDEAGVAGWYFVLKQIKEKKAALDEAEKTARERIETALGNNVDGVIDGRPVVRWSHTAAPRNFDKKSFAKDHPDLVAKYTKVGKPGRRFELIEPKADA